MMPYQVPSYAEKITCEDDYDGCTVRVLEEAVTYFKIPLTWRNYEKPEKPH
jgi:hypothetical protein